MFCSLPLMALGPPYQRHLTNYVNQIFISMDSKVFNLFHLIFSCTKELVSTCKKNTKLIKCDVELISHQQTLKEFWKLRIIFVLNKILSKGEQ